MRISDSPTLALAIALADLSPMQLDSLLQEHPAKLRHLLLTYYVENLNRVAAEILEYEKLSEALDRVDRYHNYISF